MRLTLFPLALAAGLCHAAAADCAFVDWKQYAGTRLLKHPSANAYVFSTANVKIDADGAPNAYHPDDRQLDCINGTGFKGLDCPGNAGYGKHPASWWGSALLPDPAKPAQPFVQPASSPHAGYFVSQTTLFDGSRPKTDPARYVNASTVPFLVFPGNFHAMAGTGSMGDYGYAVNLETGKGSPFIVAEIGPQKAALGEMSIALASALGGVDPNPRTGTGQPKGTNVYIVFPRSRTQPAWPRTNEQIGATVQELLGQVGGENALKACNGGS